MNQTNPREPQIPKDFTEEDAKPDRYCLRKDNSGHWYIIPLEKKERWKSLHQSLGIAIRADDTEEQMGIANQISIEFGQHRLNGGTTDLTFTNPTTKNPEYADT